MRNQTGGGRGGGSVRETIPLGGKASPAGTPGCSSAERSDTIAGCSCIPEQLPAVQSSPSQSCCSHNRQAGWRSVAAAPIMHGSLVAGAGNAPKLCNGNSAMDQITQSERSFFSILCIDIPNLCLYRRLRKFFEWHLATPSDERSGRRTEARQYCQNRGKPAACRFRSRLEPFR